MEVRSGYKQTAVGVIPEDWHVEPLASVTPPNVKNGIVDGPFGSNLKTIHYRDSRDDYEGGRITLEEFVPLARKLLPWVTLADLQPGGSGIRAKLHGPDQTFADFLIERDQVNPRVIQASGIDSPGLTSCLAIGNRVASLWREG